MGPSGRDPRQLFGLRPGASVDEVEAVYHELDSFLSLDRVPRRLRRWAVRERALADEAYTALLAELETGELGPGKLETGERDAGDSAARDAGGAQTDALAAVVAPRPPAPPVRRPAEPTVARAPADGLQTIVTEDLERSAHRRAREAAPAGHPRSAGPTAPALRPPAPRAAPGPARRHDLRADERLSQSWRRVALGLGLGLAILGVVYVGTRGLPSGLTTGFPATPAAARQQPAELDQRRVAELKAIVEKDPTNRDALFELGELHIQAGRWQETIDWFTKLLAIDPDNLHARTDVGTAHFNLGRTELAKEAWLEVARRDPNDPQIHYNLGFLYANTAGANTAGANTAGANTAGANTAGANTAGSGGTGPDIDAAIREWETVVRLAPDTELARTAQAHLEALKRK